MENRALFRINGRPLDTAIGRGRRLIDLLREDLGLRGTRFGCGEEMCGACTVLVDGEPAYACTLDVVDLAGKEVVTVEGIGTPAAPHPVQQALLDMQAGQCGYCLSGIIMSAVALIQRDPSPRRQDIVAALDRHLCRCGAHNRIIKAVEEAAARVAAEDRG